jgi:hypothetical protein
MVIMQIWSILAQKKNQLKFPPFLNILADQFTQYLDRPNPLSKMATVTENQEIL